MPKVVTLQVGGEADGCCARMESVEAPAARQAAFPSGLRFSGSPGALRSGPNKVALQPRPGPGLGSGFRYAKVRKSERRPRRSAGDLRGRAMRQQVKEEEEEEGRCPSEAETCRAYLQRTGW